ncbi:alpha-soluble NSF attachment protein [Vairimorpha necatrix]|uniref:Alpha-soluble NSF attachment protein n=1 Tax=Vairimorpha necatrix TaxID=6039 RepID=A0AAX4J9G6_9MICR
MENLKDKLIREAESLRKKKYLLFFIPISNPDYESSADKFRELSSLCQTKEEKLKYLLESVNTYLLNPIEYNRYNAFLIYQNIAEIYESDSLAIKYFILSGDMALSCNKENLAAKSYEKAFEISTNINEKINLMNKIVQCYNTNSWKHHKQNSLKILASLLFENGEYEKAAGNYLLIKSSLYNMCAGICYYLEGVESDLDVENEHKKIYESLSKGNEEIKKSVDEYVENNGVDKDVKKVLQVLLDKMSPENDIL